VLGPKQTNQFLAVFDTEKDIRQGQTRAGDNDNAINSVVTAQQTRKNANSLPLLKLAANLKVAATSQLPAAAGATTIPLTPS
jgi:hypothetical protein